MGWALGMCAAGVAVGWSQDPSRVGSKPATGLRSMKRRAFVVEQPALLSRAVAFGVPTSEAEAQALLSRGAVYVGGKRARGDVEVPVGAKVLVVLEEAGERVIAASAPKVTLRILFEDEEVLAVDKQAGVVAQPTPGRVGDSLLDLASAHLGHGAGLVHRLDRETSGVTVFGKSPQATSRLAAAFREGRARKEYLAITGPGLPASGLIELPLSKDPSRPGRWRASTKANGLDAITRYTRLADGAFCAVALFPQTGRTHQLRAHLAGLGHPIVGDALYGGAPGPRCLLHARRLTIDGLELEAPVPEDLAAFLSSPSGP